MNINAYLGIFLISFFIFYFLKYYANNSRAQDAMISNSNPSAARRTKGLVHALSDNQGTLSKSTAEDDGDDLIYSDPEEKAARLVETLLEAENELSEMDDIEHIQNLQSEER